MPFIRNATLLMATRVAVVASLGGFLPKKSFLQIGAEQSSAYAGRNTLEASVPAGCASEVPPNERIFLTTNAQPMHGTTALMTLLMSSNRLSSLCAAGVWQCEGFKLAEKVCGKQFNHCSRPILDEYSKYWELERPVLFDKEFAGGGEYSDLLSNASLTSLPHAMNKIGITRLRRAHVMMFTPLCLRGMTSSYQFAPWEEHVSPARAKWAEVLSLESLRNRHATLIADGAPVLVINYADMLWRPDYVIQRLLNFMPCLGKLDADYLPDADVIANNEFKVESSIRDYGKAKPASSIGYDVAKHECYNMTLYDELNSTFKERVVRAEAYFQPFSVH